ncbi:MAG TPA: hypothetical protein VIZ43_06140 [Trebonia sp.]
MTPDPVPRSLVGVDIEGFGRRGDLDHLDLRKALRNVCAEAFAQINVHEVHQEDRGDALLIVVGPDVPKPRLVSDLVRELGTALRRFNSRLLPQARMRLRVALHNGEVLFDDDGLAGETVVALMRLLDAQELREALAIAPDDLAVIVSDRMHHDAVVQRHRGIDPAEFREVRVSLKEFSEPAWIRVPGRPDGGVRPTDSPDSARPATGAAASTRTRGGVSFTGPAIFHGPMSFGDGDAVGGNVSSAGRDVNVAGRDVNVARTGTGQDD